MESRGVRIQIWAVFGGKTKYPTLEDHMKKKP